MSEHEAIDQDNATPSRMQRRHNQAKNNLPEADLQEPNPSQADSQTESFDKLPSRLDRHRRERSSEKSDAESDEKGIKSRPYIMTNVIFWLFMAMISTILIFVISSS